jgi:hypothetical protein
VKTEVSGLFVRREDLPDHLDHDQQASRGESAAGGSFFLANSK